jgi:hypothetical protein
MADNHPRALVPVDPQTPDNPVTPRARTSARGSPTMCADDSVFAVGTGEKDMAADSSKNPGFRASVRPSSAMRSRDSPEQLRSGTRG